MSVFRVEENANYTTMSNYHLRDENLSLKAKGLMSVFLSLPENWDYSVRGLVAICREGKDSIVRILQELEQCGYLERHQLRREDGRMGSIEYIIYEKPRQPCNGDPDTPKSFEDEPCAENRDTVEVPCTRRPCAENPDTVNPNAEKPHAGNPDPGKSCAENPPQLSKELLSKEELNTDPIKRKRGKEKESRHQYGEYRNVLLSDTEMETLKTEFPQDYLLRIERLSEYMASTGKSYKSHLATIRCWARRERKQAPVKTYSHDNYRFEEGESL